MVFLIHTELRCTVNHTSDLQTGFTSSHKQHKPWIQFTADGYKRFSFLRKPHRLWEMTQPHIKCVDYRGTATQGWSWPVPSERMSEGVPPSPTCLPGQHRDNFTQTGEPSKPSPYIRQTEHCPLQLRITAQVICCQIIMFFFRAYNLDTNQASNSIKEVLNCN